jgi:hypothetical protein
MWKLQTFTDVERRRTLRKNKILTAGFDVLDKKYRKNLKAGISALAGNSFNTNMQKRIINRLSFVYYGRLTNAFNDWKADTFRKYKEERERKVARVVDEFVRQSMSPLQKSFLKWSKYMRDMAKYDFGQQIKAGFTLTALMTRQYKDNKEKYLRLAFRYLNYNPDKIMSSSFNKMIRAAGANINTAFLIWKMNVVAGDRKKMAQAKRNLATKNVVEVIDKKRRNHLRAGLRPLADGVAQTKMQTKIFNRMHFIAFGKLKNGFMAWAETIGRVREELNRKRCEVVMRLAKATMG